MAAKTTRKSPAKPSKKSSPKKKTVAKKVTTKKVTTKKVSTKKAMPAKKSNLSSKTIKVPEVINTPEVNKTSDKVSPKTFYIAALVIALGGLLYLGRGLFVAAMVNGYPITRVELVKTLEKESGKQTLDNLITKSLITQEANKEGVTVTNQEIDDEIAKIRESLKSQNTTLEEALTMQNTSMDTLKESIKLQKMVEKMFGKDVQISDDQIKKYYDDNKSYFTDKKLADVQDSIKNQLIQQTISENYSNWLTKAKTDAKLQYFVKL
jgi:foldase protein PrsA